MTGNPAPTKTGTASIKPLITKARIGKPCSVA
ncbi:Uncharacterised protein [Vibrio cholerae]|nr:Uncharacterised protein [Vibrio cholerae]